jgi:methionyl-tRNA formyltransferase
MRVIFFGTPQFAATVLDYLFQQGVEIVAVVSKPDRPKGRSGQPVPTPVKLAAQAFNSQLPLYQPELISDPAFIPVLQAFQADLFVVVAYGEIIKQDLLTMPRLACINLHASLLPKYRGAAPIQQALINGEMESGVTIMHMVKKMDAGDMIEKVIVPIYPEMTFGELEQQLCEVGKKTLKDVIFAFNRQEILPSVSQDISQVTFAPKIELENCEIDWNRSAQDIHNLIRGVNPHPGAWCYVTVKGEKKRLKIYRSQLISSLGNSPGSLISSLPHQLVVSAKDQALELLEVQLEGKKLMKGTDFLRGLSSAHLSFDPLKFSIN